MSAANGLGGHVLLDPENIILNTSTQAPPTNSADGTPDIAFADAPAVGTTTVQIADIIGFSELFLQATNDITVANNITMVTNNSIRLEANNNLAVNGEIRTQGTGNIDLTADADGNGAGDLALNRRVFSRQGDINLSGANVVSVGAGQVLTQGLVGQNSGNVTINASNAINLVGTVTTSGRNGTAGIAGGHAGNVTINASGAITTTNIAASGGRGGSGNTAGGSAGAIDIDSTAAGDIATGSISARSGRAVGTGAGGGVGSINVNNTSGNIISNNISTFGDTNGAGGAITIAAAAGDVTVTGSVSSSGGGVATGHTKAGGNAGAISVTGTGTLNVAAINARTGSATDTGTGGNAGSIDLTASAITAAGTLSAAGNRNGAGGDINLTATVGDITTQALTANGGTANTNNTGSNAGGITINAAGAVNTTTVSASGGSGSGANQAGGNAGAINVTSTAAGDIATGSISARSGRAVGTGAGGVGSINVNNTSGNIISNNISTSGDTNGAAGDITLTSIAGNITTQAVSANGGNANTNVAGGHAGNVTVNASGAITTTNIAASGGRGGSGNADAGDAGSVTMNSTGVSGISVTNITARTGEARGTGAGGTAGSINIDNDNGAVTTGNLNTRGQRNGAGGDITVKATGGDTTVGNIDARANNIAASNGGDVTLVTDKNATVPSINTGCRWLVYSTSPLTDTIGAFKSAASFKQYNAAFGDAIPATGNGFIYTLAPTITATLTGTANKIYDGNTTASIGSLTLNQAGAIDGDTVNLSAFTSAIYDNKNVGTGKTVTSNALSITGATNGTTQVFGYEVVGSAATGNVGTVAQRAVTVSANAGQSKIISGADPLPFSFTVGGLGFVGGDGFTGALDRTAGEMLGNYAINQGSLDAGSNYTLNYTGSIFSIELPTSGTSEAVSNTLKPNNTAGLGDLTTVNEQPQALVAVIDARESCQEDSDEGSNNSNTSIILNAGIKLPNGVKPVCI